MKLYFRNCHLRLTRMVIILSDKYRLSFFVAYAYLPPILPTSAGIKAQIYEICEIKYVASNVWCEMICVVFILHFLRGCLCHVFAVFIYCDKIRSCGVKGQILHDIDFLNCPVGLHVVTIHHWHTATCLLRPCDVMAWHDIRVITSNQDPDLASRQSA
jgi:hypothetical protein